MIDCNICKHKEDYCTECKNGELFERKNVSEPKKISVSNGKEYCGHCGYLCEYARGYKKFYCIRCGGLNLRSWKNLEVKKMKKEVDGVVVEAKSILTALKIIKTVCEGNECQTCPFGKIDDITGKTLCMIKCIAPNVWIINDETDVWRALR